MFAHIHAAASGETENPMCARPGSATVLSLLAFAALAAGPALAGDTTTTLEASKDTSVFSEPVSLTATVAGAPPAGTVQFRDGAKALGTARFGGASEAFVAISTGGSQTCAVVEDGAVQCWGGNSQGQLGDGTTTDKHVPTPVTGLAGPATAIAAGAFHTCALIEGGTVQCWGDNVRGGLGDGTTTDSTTPVSVTGLGGGVTAISAGFDHTCALIEGGTVQCWGGNSQGQLGIGNRTNKNTPVSVSSLGGTVTAISAGSLYSCAVIEGGAVKCWGNNTDGELGNGNTTDQTTPVSVSGLGGAATAVAAGSDHTCALIEGDSPRCWGDNFVGALGNGTTNDSLTPVTVLGLDDVTVTAVQVANSYGCALIEGGAVKCWGEGFSGQLGIGTAGSSLTPAPVIGLGGPVAAVTTASYTACAVLASGSAMCWGSNTHGQLGNGTTDSTLVPVDVLGPSGTRTASLTIDDLDAGNHTLTAEFLDDAGSTSDALTHTVSKANTRIRKIKVKPGKPKAGQKANVTVTVESPSPATAKPEGKMKIALDGRKIANVKVKNGKAKFKLPTPAAGKHKLKVTFQNAADFKGSAGKKTVQVR
jgi:alpha-tubulin suppressor-like RCC1 family protein